MKIQLITAVAALWSCREKRPERNPAYGPNKFSGGIRNSKSGATSSSGSRCQEPRIKGGENHQRGLTPLICSMDRGNSSPRFVPRLAQPGFNGPQSFNRGDA
jgi:hypothetical protein